MRSTAHIKRRVVFAITTEGARARGGSARSVRGKPHHPNNVYFSEDSQKGTVNRASFICRNFVLYTSSPSLLASMLSLEGILPDVRGKPRASCVPQDAESGSQREFAPPPWAMPRRREPEVRFKRRIPVWSVFRHPALKRGVRFMTRSRVVRPTLPGLRNHCWCAGSRARCQTSHPLF